MMRMPNYQNRGCLQRGNNCYFHLRLQTLSYASVITIILLANLPIFIDKAPAACMYKRKKSPVNIMTNYNLLIWSINPASEKQ